MSESTCNETDGIMSDEVLASLAASPQNVTVDGQSVTERSASDIIALDKYVRAKRGACRSGGNAWARIGKAVAVPPGTQAGSDE